MASLRPLEVIWISEETIRPPGPKMVACISPDHGWFYRINTKPWRPAVLLTRSPDHPFLKWDSYLECGDPLELDDYLIEEAIARNGIIGAVSSTLSDQILAAVEQARYLRDADKAVIRAVLASIR